MKKFLMNYLMINCKEATLLMAKKEEGKLSLLGRMKLSVHTSMCSLCKMFEKQMIKIAEESKQIESEDSLPVLTKQRIERMMEEHTG